MIGLQILLPVFPSEATPLNATVAVQKKDGQVYYFTGMMPIFSHAVDDLASFRMFTSQLYVNGNCTQQEIAQTFGVSAVSVKRAVKKYRAGGAAAFFPSKKASSKKARVFTPEALAQAQTQLNAGQSKTEVAAALGIKPDTFDRAIRDGRLTLPAETVRSGGNAAANCRPTSRTADADRKSALTFRPNLL